MSVKIRRWTGASGSETKSDITDTNTRYLASDEHTVAGETNSVLVPDTGNNYSFKVTTRLYYDGTGTGTVDNIKWFTDGTNNLGTGVNLNVKTASTYSQATGTENETGDEMTGGSDAFSYTEDNPLEVAGSVTDPANEDFGDFVECQGVLDPTAEAGVKPQEQITFRFDSTIPTA